MPKLFLGLMLSLMFTACCLGQATRPVTTDRKFDAELPFVGNAIGGTTEEFIGKDREAYTLGDDSEAAKMAKKIRDAVYPKSEDARIFPQYMQGRHGAEIIGFNLRDGRINQIGFFFGNLTDDRRNNWAKAFAKVREKGKDDTTISVDGVRLRLTVDYPPAGTPNPSKRTPALIVLEVHPLDWYLLHNELSPEIEAAMRAGKLRVGMTLEQANLAMGQEGKLSTETEDAPGAITQYYNWEFYEPVPDPPFRSRSRSLTEQWIHMQEAILSEPRTREQRIIRYVRAEVMDGRVTEVNDQDVTY